MDPKRSMVVIEDERIPPQGHVTFRYYDHVKNKKR